MNFKLLISLLLSVLILNSCSDEKKTENPTAEKKEKTQALTENIPSGAPYKVKSGMLISEMTGIMKNMKVVSTTFFDDYGRKERTETLSRFEMMGNETETRGLTIKRDGYIYTIDLNEKTATRMNPKTSFNQGDFDFSAMSEELIKKYNFKKLGTEKYLDKDCEVMSFEMPAMNMKGKVWLWEGITLKSEVDMGKMHTLIAVNKIETDIPVDPGKFEIPGDIQIKEFTLPVK